MKFIIGRRQTGKTSRLVEWARGHNNRAVIVHDHATFHRLITEHCYLRDGEEPGRELMPTWQFLELGDVSGSSVGRTQYPEYAIDNLDLMLHDLLRVRGPIELVTVNGAEFEEIRIRDVNDEESKAIDQVEQCARRYADAINYTTPHAHTADDIEHSEEQFLIAIREFLYIKGFGMRREHGPTNKEKRRT